MHLKLTRSEATLLRSNNGELTSDLVVVSLSASGELVGESVAFCLLASGELAGDEPKPRFVWVVFGVEICDVP